MFTPRLPGFLHKQLQRTAARAAQEGSSPTLLERALLVGANLQKMPGGDMRPTFDITAKRPPFLGHRDAIFVDDVAALLPAYGFVLSPKAQFIVANLNIDPSHDVLTAGYKADFVMYCHLYHNNLDAVEDQRWSNPDQKIVTHRTLGGINHARTQSILAADEELWHAALDQSGALVAVNVNMNIGYGVGGMDFPTSVIARAPFKQAAQSHNLSTSMQYDILVREPAVATQRTLVPA